VKNINWAYGFFFTLLGGAFTFFVFTSGMNGQISTNSNEIKKLNKQLPTVTKVQKLEHRLESVEAYKAESEPSRIESIKLLSELSVKIELMNQRLDRIDTKLDRQIENKSYEN
jgi:septal ring factor EnvC (AmiA/AmiB activator)